MFKNVLVYLFLGLAATLCFTGCKKQLDFSDPAPEVNIDSSQIYYTQFSLFQEKNTYRTTNYRRGILIPINTAVTLQAMNSKEAELRVVDTGQPLTIVNVPKHTVDDMQSAFDKIVSLNKVDLHRFSAKERDEIMVGRVAKGMSRDAVIAAIGYPPQNQTPSLSVNDWTYWNNRFDRFIVHFKNDRVENIVN
ncbi:MAG: hypothetical protein ACU836_06645 [Gammaproteobacteria bacterium]